jgi:anaerobic selenocysteine-containing dehydrogenase
MRTIYADLSCRAPDRQCVLLPAQPLTELHVRAGDRVRVANRGMEVEADIELRDGLVVAIPRWSTLTYID